MTEPRRMTPDPRPGVRACPHPEKRVYWKQEKAEQHLGRLRTEGGSPDLHVYHCPCGAWHVGHNALSLRRRIYRSLRSARP